MGRFSLSASQLGSAPSRMIIASMSGSRTRSVISFMLPATIVES